MRNICVIELGKNEHGFLTARQTAETSCLRTYLKQRNISSMIYIDDTLPSLHDLAEDILSVADDALVAICNEGNALLLNALISRIISWEELPIYVIGKGEPLPCFGQEHAALVWIDEERPEEKLLQLLAPKEDKGCSLVDCSPYTERVLIAQDAPQYGIWFGRKLSDGEVEYRTEDSLREDIKVITQAFSGLDTENVKLIPGSGASVGDKTYLSAVINMLPGTDTPLRFTIPVTLPVLDEYPVDLGAPVLVNVSIDKDDVSEQRITRLSVLLERGVLIGAEVTVEALEQEESLRRLLFDAAKSSRIFLKVRGEFSPEQFDKEEQDVLMRAAALRYVPFSRGFMKSRTGVYSGVPLDGYVKHVELLTEHPEDISLECLNEIASVNSSVFWNKTACGDEVKCNVVLDGDGVATVPGGRYENYREQMLDRNIIESNLLIMENGRMRVNNLAYASIQDLAEIPYREAKSMMREMQKQSGKDIPCFYIYTMDSEEDYSLFLQDAEQFRETHTLEGLPLAHGYLKNYCRFMGSSACSVDKMPRIQLTGDGNVYVCSNFSEPVGETGQAIFELTQNCYVKKEKEIKARGCTSCAARSWCAKCTQMPSWVKESYCDVMQNKTYVIDYVMSSLVYIDMTSSVPKMRRARPEEIKVTSEYMANTEGMQGSEAPYFPKFSYMFAWRDEQYVLWSAASGKFFNISPQYALFAEMLFRRLPVQEIKDQISEKLSITGIESEQLCGAISRTLNQSGALYRVIKEN